MKPHLGKCFEGIANVKFRGDSNGNKEDVLITHMVSTEGETVEFLVKTDPEKGSNKGNVEKWLLEMQNFMRLTIKDVVIKAMEAYPKTRRDKWVLDWPAQVVLNVSQVRASRAVLLFAALNPFACAHLWCRCTGPSRLRQR